MRIWDLPPARLCRQHLLGEHAELHALWAILTGNKKGYARHPETLRWQGKLRALYRRHEAQVAEMERRGWRHRSPLDPALATGAGTQDERVDTLAAQIRVLRAKGCACRTGKAGQPRSSGPD
jgi:hypothetical protein